MVTFGLAVVCSFLIVFRVKRKMRVWGFQAKGGELSHLNTNRLSGAILPMSTNLSFSFIEKIKVENIRIGQLHLMPLALCYVRGSLLSVAPYPTRGQN